ncbi:uncharacterized protein K452DRAFT_88884 [Aplosporella prunicola CBS 121167]|uniref:D-aminoacyl-tRNA deacylase n=1 Tax=Aplosporella prunicola CBS 121167 TaxID=1176127 RepID=A0A6A6B338_9PEZI|nr:uncharacterized protein K452DRAFT_88884 [Aplosporella prunicola CBS 121167]KAF2138599.1 hypothetical protein K452DRAFT_88884 [Aplosporella prunicola CBS 121167]
MKAVLQRVKSASVTVDGKLISNIGMGILVFAAVGKDDTQAEVERMASKVLKMQMWDDEEGGKWKRNVRDLGGEVLCVSQFTLLASTKKGNKPSFHNATADNARQLYTSFFAKVQDLYEKDKVKDGVFQAMMDVSLVNDGPVGLDYRCEDEAVTLEIDCDPPKMNVPGNADSGSSSEGDKVKIEELLTKIGRLQKQFNIPAELLR